jgi:hypothetical protein
MRGSALRAFGGASIPRAPRVLAGDFQPRAPRPRGALPLVGSPASEAFRSDTSDAHIRGQGVRPLGAGAQRALLSETSAQDMGRFPFLHHPRTHLAVRV